MISYLKDFYQIQFYFIENEEKNSDKFFATLTLDEIKISTAI